MTRVSHNKCEQFSFINNKTILVNAMTCLCYCNVLLYGEMYVTTSICITCGIPACRSYANDPIQGIIKFWFKLPTDEDLHNRIQLIRCPIMWVKCNICCVHVKLLSTIGTSTA